MRSRNTNVFLHSPNLSITRSAMSPADESHIKTTSALLGKGHEEWNILPSSIQIHPCKKSTFAQRRPERKLWRGREGKGLSDRTSKQKEDLGGSKNTLNFWRNRLDFPDKWKRGSNKSQNRVDVTYGCPQKSRVLARKWQNGNGRRRRRFLEFFENGLNEPESIKGGRTKRRKKN